MKTLFIPPFARTKNAIIIGVLASLAFWIYPESQLLAYSEQPAGQNTALVFEIKNSTTITDNNSLSINEVVKNDPLAKNLKNYLENLGSPLAQYAEDIIQQPQWQRALAISWVESNMGIHCYYNNCSGIGGAPGDKTWRKYSTQLDWFKDMAQLLEQPLYKEQLKTFKQMRGIYVKPGSANWVYGAQDKFDELMELTQKSEQQRQVLAQEAPVKLALATFPNLTSPQ